MPSLEFFIVATGISIDQRTNRLSILEVIEEISPLRFPAMIPRAVALTGWIFDEGDQGQDFQAVLRITGAGLEEPKEFRQNFRGEGKSQRVLFNLVEIPVFGEGVMLFEMLLNGQRNATHQIRISAADPSVDNDGFLVYWPRAVALPQDAAQPEQD